MRVSAEIVPASAVPRATRTAILTVVVSSASEIAARAVLVESAAATPAETGARPAPGQPTAQPLAPSRLPALDGTHRAAESTGGLLVSQTLQVAEHHGSAKAIRQAADLLVDRDFQLVGRSDHVALGTCRHLRTLPLTHISLHGQDPGVGRDTQRYGMEPRTKRILKP